MAKSSKPAKTQPAKKLATIGDVIRRAVIMNEEITIEQLTGECRKAGLKAVKEVTLKIGLYEDPEVKGADGKSITTRVLTIMLAEEY